MRWLDWVAGLTGWRLRQWSMTIVLWSTCIGHLFCKEATNCTSQKSKSSKLDVDRSSLQSNWQYCQAIRPVTCFDSYCISLHCHISLLYPRLRQIVRLSRHTYCEERINNNNGIYTDIATAEPSAVIHQEDLEEIQISVAPSERNHSYMQVTVHVL